MGNKIIIGSIILLWIIGIGVVIIVKSQEKKAEPVKVAVMPTLTPMPTQALGVKEEKVTDLKIEDIKIGTGAEAVSGKAVTVNYRGTLTDGTQFDSSYDRSTPFTFNLGAGEVIKGWDLGVQGMKIGGKRKLTIPANLGYGARVIGTIPANSTLIFEVELLKVE
jgi:FKBP-type peptidyl-prolyl cis-trans isomerase